jgi:hypothetical protein
LAWLRRWGWTIYRVIAVAALGYAIGGGARGAYPPDLAGDAVVLVVIVFIDAWTMT